MESPQTMGGTRFTRRQTTRLGIAAGAAMMLGGKAPRSAVAQATPVGSPTAYGGYPHSELLVDAAWLSERRGDPAMVAVGLMPAEEFAKGHVPGTVQLDWPALEVIDTSDESISRWSDGVTATLASLGITRDRDVVAYDAGTLFASRLWWVLYFLGHEGIHVLNGGLAAWQEGGGEVTTGASLVTPAAGLSGGVATGSPRLHALAQLEEVRTRLDDPRVAIVDARTPGEYAQGHIPGAINLNYPMNAVSGSPSRWKAAEELLAMYEDAGIRPDQRVFPYCSSGVRSAVTFFSLRLIGYEDVGLYTGSWQEWSAHPELPVVNGTQPGK